MKGPANRFSLGREKGQRRSNKFYLQFLPDAVLYPAKREHIMLKTFVGHRHSFKIALVGTKRS